MLNSCWYCEKDPGFTDGELEKHCQHCGVLNDRNPYPPIKEEEMPFETEGDGKAVYLKFPKEGESYDYSQHGEITKIEKVENVDKKKGFNFTKKVDITLPSGKTAKVDEDCGYYYLIEFTDGSKLSLSSWSPFYAMKKVGVTEGDSINIDHQEKGKWLVTKL